MNDVNEKQSNNRSKIRPTARRARAIRFGVRVDARDTVMHLAREAKIVIDNFRGRVWLQEKNYSCRTRGSITRHFI